MTKLSSTEIILIFLFLIGVNILTLNSLYPNQDIIQYVTTFDSNKEVVRLMTSLGKSRISGIEIQ